MVRYVTIFKEGLMYYYHISPSKESEEAGIELGARSVGAEAVYRTTIYRTGQVRILTDAINKANKIGTLDSAALEKELNKPGFDNI